MSCCTQTDATFHIEPAVSKEEVETLKKQVKMLDGQLRTLCRQLHSSMDDKHTLKKIARYACFWIFCLSVSRADSFFWMMSRENQIVLRYGVVQQKPSAIEKKQAKKRMIEQFISLHNNECKKFQAASGAPKGTRLTKVSKK